MSTLHGPLVRLVWTVAHIICSHIRFSTAVHMIELRWTPHPGILTIRDNRDYIRVLLYSYYITITGWGVLLR